MEKTDYAEESESDETLVDLMKAMRKSPYRYTKEQLLEIRECPPSNQRPDCLSEKYNSDGIWDPEKWHASLYPNSERSSPVDGIKKDLSDDRIPLKRRIADPRERVKEDEIDVVLSPQRRSFGGGCQVNVPLASITRRAVSPLENKENENSRVAGSRRIGSGRIIASRVFEREMRTEKDVRDRESHPRERDYKDKRFRRDFGDKRIFGERRRNDSYTEEEPEWFSGGPTSQSETIELTGFDDKILEEDKRRYKRSRKRSEPAREVECNGGLIEEAEVEISSDTAADQEVPNAVELPEPASGDFDFNEFFNLDKTVPGLASMIEDVLGEGSIPAASSRFSQWFSRTHSPSASRSSSLRSTPHEELERLAGLEHVQEHGLTNYFAPIHSGEEKREKVDILEMLHKAKVDLKPLLSSLTANKEKLKESSNSGVVLSLEEVEVGLKGLKVEVEQKVGTPFMAEQLEEVLTAAAGSRPAKTKDGDMSAFNKLVSSMKASGTLPSPPKVNCLSLGMIMQNLNSQLVHPPELPVQNTSQKNLLQEILRPQISARSSSPNMLSGLLGSTTDPSAPVLSQHPSPPLFPQRTPSPDYYPIGLPSNAGFVSSPQPLLSENFSSIHQPVSPRQVSLTMDQATLEALSFQQDLAMQARQIYQSGYNKIQPDKARDGFRNRPQRLIRSPGPGVHRATASSPVNSVTSMLSPSFTPTSVIRKMYESKEKCREESTTVKSSQNTEEGSRPQDDITESADRGSKPCSFPRSTCSTPLSNQSRFTKDQEYRPRSAGRRTPTIVSPVPSASFPRPVCPVPLVPHVSLVRPTPPSLHPGVVQRMLTQGIAPQQLPPALLQAGIFPQSVDLSHLQGLPPPLISQPFYSLTAAGHPLLSPRPGAPLHLAMMQQRHGPSTPIPSSLPQTLQHSAAARTAPPLAPQRHSQGSASPVGLAKWFGSDVLQQPLPSMPAKVISVDELEFRQ
ncbi:eukaryotic translation initiation factor 4E transporter isoform X2 [Polypterus senegalus]|uniref:eukaryotic translation initiation factor 4E transporter isoform X2 n=1 Tax=Polypterus senegalus TaxID=55291 RepID=UPI001964283E|nr:eukaryotic translation initiation factor 4E transporter isoform X2 [Polypterus senegalus]